MNWEQVKGVVERILIVGATYAVAKGWLPESISGDLVAGVLLLAGAIWGWKVNTPAALKQAADATKP